MSREAMKLALEALGEYVNVVVSVNDPNEWTPKVEDAGGPAREAITALREALAEQPAQQEPVAVKTMSKIGKAVGYWRADLVPPHIHPDSHDITPLYTRPQACEPLTDEQIEDAWERITGHSIFGGDRAAGRAMYLSPNEVTEFARAIEAAHGIKENT